MIVESYGYTSDDNSTRGFIDLREVLNKYRQEQIFSLVFGFEPEEGIKVTSPFREDEIANCWFEWYDGKLRFIDFANNSMKQGIRMNNIDCFNAVMLHFGLPDLYQTIQFIESKLKGYESSKLTPIISKTPDGSKKITKLLVTPREDFTKKDLEFWLPYGIVKKQLVEDKVFSVREFHLLNDKKGNSFISKCTDLAFAYTDFNEGRKKIYFPERLNNHRFLSTCTQNDVGGINSFLYAGEKAIITKSYKDYRVLKNFGLNVVWLQNEGMVPDMDLLKNLVVNHKKIFVWFDNDRAGIEAANKITNIINMIYLGKASTLWIPEPLLKQGIKDPSDWIKAQGFSPLNEFIKKFINESH